MPGPQRISNILSELMARRGYGRVQSTQAYEEAWRQAAGALAAQYTAIGSFRRGTLEVMVANSTLVQELTFQKDAILKSLNELLPEQNIRNLRFRVGTID
jgi:hypothetical protein